MRTTIPKIIIGSTPFLDKSKGEAPSFRCEIYSRPDNGARVTSGILAESTTSFNLGLVGRAGFGMDDSV
jgi:hypothetical protein